LKELFVIDKNDAGARFSMFNNKNQVSPCEKCEEHVVAIAV